MLLNCSFCCFLIFRFWFKRCLFLSNFQFWFENESSLRYTTKFQNFLLMILKDFSFVPFSKTIWFNLSLLMTFYSDLLWYIEVNLDKKKKKFALKLLLSVLRVYVWSFLGAKIFQISQFCSQKILRLKKITFEVFKKAIKTRFHQNFFEIIQFFCACHRLISPVLFDPSKAPFKSALSRPVLNRRVTTTKSLRNILWNRNQSTMGPKKDAAGAGKWVFEEIFNLKSLISLVWFWQRLKQRPTKIGFKTELL